MATGPYELAFAACHGGLDWGWERSVAKRVIDLGVSTVLAVVTLPLVVLMAIGLSVELRAWPFFVQERGGRGGRSMKIVKLRTLPVTTPTDADKYELTTVRVPPFARLLRALHLDELPQLWLVVAGHMSLVGPRPEMPHLLDRIPPAARRARESVRPGCTGLWQISQHVTGLIHEHPEYDVTYVEQRSLRLDLWIMWRTVPMLLLGRHTDVALETIDLRDEGPVDVQPVAARVERAPGFQGVAASTPDRI